MKMTKKALMAELEMYFEDLLMVDGHKKLSLEADGVLDLVSTNEYAIIARGFDVQDMHVHKTGARQTLSERISQYLKLKRLEWG